MLTPPSGTGKYTTHGPHYAALRSHYAALGPRPNGLRPSGSIMGPSGSIMFGPRAVYFPVSLGQGQHIIPRYHPACKRGEFQMIWLIFQPFLNGFCFNMAYFEARKHK